MVIHCAVAEVAIIVEGSPALGPPSSRTLSTYQAPARTNPRWIPPNTLSWMTATASSP